jgi:hypothetical protein
MSRWICLGRSQSSLRYLLALPVDKELVILYRAVAMPPREKIIIAGMKDVSRIFKRHRCRPSGSSVSLLSSPRG